MGAEPAGEQNKGKGTDPIPHPGMESASEPSLHQSSYGDPGAPGDNNLQDQSRKSGKHAGLGGQKRECKNNRLRVQQGRHE